jgi:hypothetical protein
MEHECQAFNYQTVILCFHQGDYTERNRWPRASDAPKRPEKSIGFKVGTGPEAKMLLETVHRIIAEPFSSKACR